MRLQGGVVGALLFAFMIAAGCGSERPPAAGDGLAGASNRGTGNQFSADAGGFAPPGCGTKPDGSQCDCVDVPLFTDPPTIYFVLDRSGSMGAENKWTQIRVVVGKIMRGLGPRARFGAAIFPGALNNDVCAPGLEIMSIRDGDPPSSSIDGPTTSALLTSTGQILPAGGTPTAATLVNVRASLLNAPGKKFVILATDGAPNCNGGANCAVDQCQSNIEAVGNCVPNGLNCCEDLRYRVNCNDVNATLRSIEDLASATIPVYVVGLPGASTYRQLLDDMAIAGGTALPAEPKYFAVDAATESVMLAALKKIAAKIIGTCAFDLKEAPANPALVNVYMDDVALPYEPVNGWAINGKTVTLLGGACDKVKNGDVFDIRIIAGCPRIEPR